MLSRTANKSFIKGIRNPFLNARVSDRDPKTLDESIQIATAKERESNERNEHFAETLDDRSANTSDRFIKIP